MADVPIKPEIKVDPTDSTPIIMAELEEFEDDTDLNIPPNGAQAWLAKVPQSLWEKWYDIFQNAADDQPIEIGKMRVFTQKKPGESMERVQMHLDSNVPQHREIPQVYNLKWSGVGANNTAVFSEKDLPGHRNHPSNRNRLAANKPSGVSKSDRYPPVKPGTYRSAIPKQVSLAPKIHHVADAEPLQDKKFIDHFITNYDKSLRPKDTAKYIPIVQKGPTTDLGAFGNFNTSTKVPGGRKGGKDKPKEKAVRMSRDELLNALYRCFRQYRYWSLKALRHHLKQPEVFIKQTLESIATLVRSGDFAMNYRLLPEYAAVADIKEEEVDGGVAQVKSEPDTDDGEDDGGDEGEFEDVVMGGAGPSGT